jgi:hypothetical protein
MLKVTDEQFDEYAARLLKFAKSEHIDGQKLLPSFLHLKTQATDFRRSYMVLVILINLKKYHRGVKFEV